MRKYSSCIRLFAFATLSVGAVLPRASVAQPRPFNKQRVTYTHGALTLVGYIYKPDGRGASHGGAYGKRAARRPARRARVREDARLRGHEQARRRRLFVWRH